MKERDISRKPATGASVPPRRRGRATGRRCGRAAATARIFALALLVLFCADVSVGRTARGLEEDRLRALFFAPELVMTHQSEIGLNEAQKAALVEEMQQAQHDLVPLQLEIGEATEGLRRLLEGPRVDEAAALAEAERVMNLESRIKSRHMSLVIRIKNLLTEEQQNELRRIRNRRALDRPRR